MQNRTINFPLFWKFAIISTIVVLIFGAINIYLLWTSVYSSFEKEIDKRCLVLAKITAGKSLTPILYNDEMGLFNVLNEVKQSDQSISYIFVLNKNNQLIAQTYGVIIPEKLLSINGLKDNLHQIKAIKTENYKYPVIRDIAFPIMDGEIGTIRLGIVEDHIQQEIKEATFNLILMIVIFLGLGLLGAFIFSYIITSPIKKISQKAQELDLNLIDKKGFNLDSHKNMTILNVPIIDELDVLETKFSEMVNRLQNSFVELQNTQSALIQAEKLVSLGRLSAGVAHEINNPISGIKNCLNRIHKNPQNIEQNATYFELIKEATERIENVVKHLLNFSREQDVYFQEMALNESVENAVKQTRHKLEKDRIQIQQSINSNIRIKGSSLHLEQVLINLILNSLDAINERIEREPNHIGKLDIVLEESDSKLWALVRIKDNGMGIPNEIKDKIFDPFFTSKKIGEGTGLGLYLTFNLIIAHKGEINFVSQEGSGTEFIIKLPLQEE